MAGRSPDRKSPVAIMDIGSNSGRVVVYQPEAGGHLRLVSGARASLRLVRALDATGRLGSEAIDQTLEALSDFRAIALGAGAARIRALATAAVREAADGVLLVARARRELGLTVEVLDGPTEARYGFLGAVRGLSVDSGLLFDMGGGSLQLTRFRGRRSERALSLPLGSLRLSERFLATDPPRKSERRLLRQHVFDALESAGIRPLEPGERLIGTGGTCRNLAKIDRRARSYPVTRLHGYEISRRRLASIVASLARRPERRRGRVPGLSRDRGDSIAGGGLGILALLEHLGSREILVAGQGVREGAAYDLLDGSPPTARQSRQRSLRALARRFVTWDERRAERRRDLVAGLARAIRPVPTAEVRCLLPDAAGILDIGTSLDYFERHEHASDIVLATDIEGFTHREVALLSAMIRAASEDAEPLRYAPLLSVRDERDVTRAGVLLALADDIEERCHPSRPLRLVVACRGGVLQLRVTGLLGWRPRGLAERVRKSFGLRLEVEPA